MCRISNCGSEQGTEKSDAQGPECTRRLPEERRARGEDEFVRLNLAAVRDEGDVEELFVVADLAEGAGHVRLAVDSGHLF